MASSPSNQASNYHNRSNSLPARSHPLVQQCNEHLRRLSASDTSSSSLSSSLRSKLDGLRDLHECVEKLLQLPLTQQALAQEFNRTWVEELLDGSLRLLDLCSASKDALIHTKECIRELQSIIRRRPAGDVGLEREVRKYMMSRKIVKNAVQKALKGVQRKCADKNPETPVMVSSLREAEAITINVFESLMCYVAGSKSRAKSSNWSLVSKLVLSKRIACENEERVSCELEKVDAALHSIIRPSKSDYAMHVENVHNLLVELEPTFQDLEEGLECLFRRLIKTRVSLLNIFNY